MRMAGDNNIFEKSKQMQAEMMRRHDSIKNVMDRQTARDVAATQGRMIPFSSADILPMESF